MNEMIRTENLGRRFGSVEAVAEVSLSVRPGEIYGFLGLNGAGKTTTIRMLLGLVRPTVGRVLIDGQEIVPGRSGLWNRVGYLVETPSAYPELTVEENLRLIARLRLLSRPAEAVTRVIRQLDLSAFAGRQARHLSLGNAQRLGLAKALIHDPELLILDEPSNALDPAGIVEIRTMLQTMARERGKTVFVSSHNLDEVSRFADRIGIIHEGHMVHELAMEDVQSLTSRQLEVGTTDLAGAKRALEAAGYEVRDGSGCLWLPDVRAVERPEDVNLLLVRSGLTPSRLVVREENLEAYFLRAIGNTGEQQ